MRVLLVGSPAERDRLRARVGDSMDIAGEFSSLAAARAAEVDADAIMIAHAPTDAGDAFDEPLTAREVQVVELLAEGLPNKAIAARLGISDQTVKFHLASIAGKLGAANRTDTVRRAVRRGVITL